MDYQRQGARPKAVFLCDGNQIFDAYDADALARLRTRLDLPQTVVSSRTLKEHGTMA